MKKFRDLRLKDGRTADSVMNDDKSRAAVRQQIARDALRGESCWIPPSSERTFEEIYIHSEVVNALLDFAV